MSHTRLQPITQESLMPPRLVAQRPGPGISTGKALVLDSAKLILGRDSECDLRFDDSGVSRKHATISMGAEGVWLVTDMQSTNGTWLNGRRVTQSRLKDGDELRLGPNLVFTFSWAGHAAAGGLDRAAV